MVQRTGLYYADSQPPRLNEPVPTGWHEAQTAQTANNYRGTTSDERILLAQEAVQLVPPAQSVKDYLGRANADIIR